MMQAPFGPVLIGRKKGTVTHSGENSQNRNSKTIKTSKLLGKEFKIAETLLSQQVSHSNKINQINTPIMCVS